MGGSIFSRKCLGFEAVSRVGPSTRAPFAPASNSSAHLPVAIIVVAAAVSALLCLCIFVLVFRSVRRRRSLESNMSNTGSAGGYPEPTDWRKSREGDEEEADRNEGDGRRSTQQVEQLVVMAGEEMPTYLAHRVPAPSLTATNLHIQCPPLHVR